MVFGRFGAKQKKQGRHWLPCRDVTTSQCHDFATSRRLINRGKSISDPTSRRHHDFCASIIKSKGRPNFGGIEERADLRAENIAEVTRIIGEDTSFCISSFLINYG